MIIYVTCHGRGTENAMLHLFSFQNFTFQHLKIQMYLKTSDIFFTYDQVVVMIWL